LLGTEGPKTANPTKYIRYIYNRVVLENALVRAAAVTALAKFGVGQKDAEVKKSVTVLLTRCLDDVDDEVRDRAALNLRLMKEDDEVASNFIRNGKSILFSIRDKTTNLYLDSMFSLPILEHQLVMYVTADSVEAFSKPFDLSSVPVVTREQSLAEDRTRKLTSATPTLKAPSTGPKSTSRAANQQDTTAASIAASQKYASQLQAIPDIAAFGGVLRSSPVIELTESETEYVVTAIKHIFKSHLVIQYQVKNTLPATVLSDASVICTPADDHDGLVEIFSIPAPSIKSDETATIYVAFTRPESEFLATSFANNLKFTSKEIDPSTNEPSEQGYEDEYETESLELQGSDYVLPAFAGSFDSIYNALPTESDHSAESTFNLPELKGLQEGAEHFISQLGMQPLEGSEVVLSGSTHALRLYGKSIVGGKVAALVRMAFSAKSGVTVKIGVRSEEAGLADAILSPFG